MGRELEELEEVPVGNVLGKYIPFLPSGYCNKYVLPLFVGQSLLYQVSVLNIKLKQALVSKRGYARTFAIHIFMICF